MDFEKNIVFVFKLIIDYCMRDVIMCGGIIIIGTVRGAKPPFLSVINGLSVFDGSIIIFPFDLMYGIMWAILLVCPLLFPGA